MDTLKESAPIERAPVDIAEFKNRVGKADGTLTPLVKKSKQGSKLYVSSKYIANPTLEDSIEADKSFWGWQDDTLGTMTGVVLVDVYAEETGETRPVGHMDWWLQGDYANGGGNMHAAMAPRNEVEKRASEKWYGSNTAFKVLPEYQKQQLGSLMLAISSAVLPSLGVAAFYSGVLLDPAESAYKRFDITPDDFWAARPKHSQHWKDQKLPIERLSNHPHVDEVINHFLQAS